jgi:hypothetical protein
METDTCPKIFHVATALEIWEGRQSLGLTDPPGRRDLHEGKFVRTYIMGSTQHGSAPFPPTFGNCQQQTNPNPQRETMRALWVAFTDWIKDGVRPPPSRVPMIRDRTLVHPEEVAFPYIPANDYDGVSRPAVKFLALANPLHVLDFGPLFDHEDESGMVSNHPPLVSEAEYTILVPQVDGDGNDLGGILSTAVQAPLATYTGWNLGREGLWEDSSARCRAATSPSRRPARNDWRSATRGRRSKSATGLTKATWPPCGTPRRSWSAPASFCPRMRSGWWPRPRQATS